MIRADVSADGSDFTLDIRKGEMPGQVDICWMGTSKDTRLVMQAGDWSGVAASFCRKLSGTASTGLKWGMLLHLCGLIFWFGDIAVPGGSSALSYTPIQKELVEIWRKYGRTGTRESAIEAIGRMIEVGGRHSLSD